MNNSSSNKKYYDKYIKYKHKYLALARTAGDKKFYYHGSPTKLEKLEPRPSFVINNESAVFATDKRYLALVFIAKANDQDIELGFINNKPYILEQYPGAFDKFLKKKSGYIYYLDPKQFKQDKRLGMYNHEFISYNPVNILKTEKIKDIYEELVKSELNIVTFDMKVECIDKIIS